MTPLPPHSSPPSRSSTASNSPVEAPEGTAAQPAGAAIERNLDLDGGVAARVEDLARVDRSIWLMGAESFIPAALDAAPEKS